MFQLKSRAFTRNLTLLFFICDHNDKTLYNFFPFYRIKTIHRLFFRLCHPFKSLKITPIIGYYKRARVKIFVCLIIKTIPIKNFFVPLLCFFVLRKNENSLYWSFSFKRNLCLFFTSKSDAFHLTLQASLNLLKNEIKNLRSSLNSAFKKETKRLLHFLILL